ncbi:MAG: 50S ribosomal subunit protein L18 [Candidatus Westeberhardia cardiocondylae]|nr:50S ribosomal subunit protein L18 [Candidatus Westeberhardia cardiocondylae]
MVISKKLLRIRRFFCLRSKLKRLSLRRLVIHRTSRHIYAQIVVPDGSRVLVAASTIEKNIKNKLLGYTGNKVSSVLVGKIIARRALDIGIKQVVFDRSGFKYHGRIRSLADSARKEGLIL